MQNTARRWAQVLARDASADGQFFYAVRSTGVYCRPSCPSRRPRRELVSFHVSRAAAENAGFRPCRRCHPEREAADAIARVCGWIEQQETPPRLAEAAQQAGLSPRQFARRFRSRMGISLRAYTAARRSARARAELKQRGDVTGAIYAAGFNSSGRFYADAERRLGMTPSDFRRGGAGQDIRFAIGRCRLGAVAVGATGRGICAVMPAATARAARRALQAEFPAAHWIAGGPKMEEQLRAVIARIDGKNRAALELPLDIRGTVFQERVWQALRKIPAGKTASYGAVARQVGSGARAVARACAANRLAVVVPCHRVVGSDGASRGYRWGRVIQRQLLEAER